MTPEVTKLLTELYAVDPKLQAHETVLVKLIEELLLVRPQVNLSLEFQSELKTRLLSRARELKLSHRPQGLRPWFGLLKRVQPSYVMAAAVLVLAVVVYGSYQVTRRGQVYQPRRAEQLALTTRIRSVGERAFGRLKFESESARDAAPVGLGGGRGVLAPSAMPQPQSELKDQAASESLVVPPYQPVTYRFKYRGDELENLPTEVEVLKRLPGQGLSGFESLLASLGGGGVDLESFSNAKLVQFTLNQDEPYGYSLYVDAIAGSLSINQNYLRWPQPLQSCRDQACFDALQFKVSDVPAELELIGLAQGFLQQHGIGLEGYGEPEVQNDWRLQYERLSQVERATYPAPEVVTVLFPQLIGGQEVFEGGAKVGLGVGISLRDKKVSGVWNITTRAFESSVYEAETDMAAILRLAEQGGYFMGYVPESDAQVVERELDTPHRAYVKVWQYRAASTGDELYVPALAFPIIQPPQGGGFYPAFVVVPLVKDFWNNQPPVQILPFKGTGSSQSPTLLP